MKVPSRILPGKFASRHTNPVRDAAAGYGPYHRPFAERYAPAIFGLSIALACTAALVAVSGRI